MESLLLLDDDDDDDDYFLICDEEKEFMNFAAPSLFAAFNSGEGEGEDSKPPISIMKTLKDLMLDFADYKGEKRSNFPTHSGYLTDMICYICKYLRHTTLARSEEFEKLNLDRASAQKGKSESLDDDAGGKGESKGADCTSGRKRKFVDDGGEERASKRIKGSALSPETPPIVEDRSGGAGTADGGNAPVVDDRSCGGGKADRENVPVADDHSSSGGTAEGENVLVVEDGNGGGENIPAIEDGNVGGAELVVEEESIPAIEEGNVGGGERVEGENVPAIEEGNAGGGERVEGENVPAIEEGNARGGERVEGANVPVLIMCRKLNMSDISTQQQRLSMPCNQVASQFLTAAEIEKLGRKEYVAVAVVDPEGRRHGANLRWTAAGPRTHSFAIGKPWNEIKKLNGFKVGMEIKIWAVRGAEKNDLIICLQRKYA